MPTDYVEVRRLGEGSIGSVSLVRRKKGTEGGSAYSRHAHKSIVKSIFGCCFQRPKVIERSPSNTHAEKQSQSFHSEEYALKSIQLRLVQQSYLNELRNEIEVLRSLDHPNIVKAYEVYENKRNIYVLMEFCSGGDLYARAPYIESDAASLVTQLCSAIAHMHKNRVVHRDLKFENIMFESKDPMAKIKVLDFGLSKKFLPGASKIMTEGVGTVYTMAPQVFKGIYTSKADCWSIGVIAFILLCQEKPFAGKKRSEMVHSIMQCRYNFKAVGWRGVSEEAKDFVSKLLVINPSVRMSAQQALDHPWLKKKEYPILSETDSRRQNSLLVHVKDNIMAYANMSEMRRIASMVVAHKSSTQEILEMRDAFDKYDVQRDGVISMEEFKAALSEFNYTDDELNDLFIRMVRNTTSNFPVSLTPIYTHCSHLE